MWRKLKTRIDKVYNDSFCMIDVEDLMKDEVVSSLFKSDNGLKRSLTTLCKHESHYQFDGCTVIKTEIIEEEKADHDDKASVRHVRRRRRNKKSRKVKVASPKVKAKVIVSIEDDIDNMISQFECLSMECEVSMDCKEPLDVKPKPKLLRTRLFDRAIMNIATDRDTVSVSSRSSTGSKRSRSDFDDVIDIRPTKKKSEDAIALAIKTGGAELEVLRSQVVILEKQKLEKDKLLAKVDKLI